MNFKHLLYFWQVAKSGGVAKAAEQLHLTPQTISGQLQLLEERLRIPLFRKSGRKLELTEAGKLAFGYAENIFSLGIELEETINQLREGNRLTEFRVGVADAVPKTIAYHLLEPATRLSMPVRIVCREWALPILLAELAVHRLDLVITDAPLPSSSNVRAYSHRLGKSGMSFFAAPGLAAALGAFPGCLDNAPLLLPGPDAAIRDQLEGWFQTHRLKPRISGEFDDTALMKVFGRNGIGLFPAPSVLEEEIEAQYGVKTIGSTEEVKQEFFAISVERQVTHPCVLVITENARAGLFGE